MPTTRVTSEPPLRPIIVWFRNDLRLSDNPALTAAVASGHPVIPVYILDERPNAARTLGGAARWWLHHSLRALEASLGRFSARSRHGPRLILRRGAPGSILKKLIETTGATRVLCNRSYDPALDAVDATVQSALRGVGAAFESLPGALLAEPAALLTGSGGPFRIFTAFWNRLSTLPIAEPLSAPRTIPGWTRPLESEQLDEWALRPSIPWDAQFDSVWTPGEQGAAARRRTFLSRRLADYHATRDYPALEGTSRLSPHLRFGEISARGLWHAVRRSHAGSRTGLAGNGFLRELGWREFAQHSLHHFPSLPERALRREFDAFAWREDRAALEAWQRGRTGYPIVDAGMRELWHTGWMHNRVRMIVGSFLVKDLLITWQHGEAWFWDTLVDADRASNALNWQWVSGCGVDAAPYFRIFNPVTQSMRFDPEGAYLRKWLPSLRALPAPALHAPWTAPAQVLARAGVRLGETYPLPIVEHDTARKRALARFEKLRQRARSHR